jgi:hypothetical protein
MARLRLRQQHRRRARSTRTLGGAPALAALCALALAACGNQEIQSTTRTLDRPGALAMVCAGRIGDAGFVTGLNASRCTTDAGAAGSGTTDARVGAGYLYGFVANMGRSEVTMFRPSAYGEKLVDVDRASPGYNSIPVGSLPSDLKSSADGCRVVTANSGSCDLSLIDVPSVLQVVAGELKTPASAAVSRILPRTAAGPLRAQPQELVIVPKTSSAKKPEEKCPAVGPYHVFVTFPRCNLLAEIDLATGLVVQGLVVGRSGFTLTKNPVCPVECLMRGEVRLPDLGQRPEARPPDAIPDVARVDLPPSPVDRGPDKTAIDAGAPREAAPDTTSPVDAGAHREAAPAIDGVVSKTDPWPFSIAITEEGDRIYLSSAGAGFITVVDVNATSGAFENPRRLPVSGDVSTLRVRLSPKTRKLGRFIYAVARDRSVRVISAELERECETNLDLTKVAQNGIPLDTARCYVVGDPKTPPRRVTSKSAGFTFGARVPEDVVFFQATPAPTDSGTREMRAAPLNGVFAIIAISDGNLYVVDIEDWDALAADAGVLPPGSISLPHRLRNAYLNTVNGVPDAAVSTITTPGDGGIPVIVSQEIPPGKDFGPDMPGQGVFLRAPGEVVGTQWNMVYEDRLMGRWSGNLAVGADKLTLSDPGTDFCAAGVLGRELVDGRAQRHGDILIIVGCKDDTECGVGQICVKPVAYKTDYGLCFDENRRDDLFKQCSEYLRSPREYLISQASEESLTLDVLPIEPQKIIRQSPQPAGGCTRNEDCQPTFLCALEKLVGATAERSLAQGECFRPGCEKDSDCGSGRCLDPLDGSAKVCATVPLPLEKGGSCVTDADCLPQKSPLPELCTDDNQCGGNAECRSASSSDKTKHCFSKGMICAKLPGLSNRCVRKSPCFTDLVRYDVVAGRSFIIGGYRRVIPDPLTGVCGLNPKESALLNQRVPVGLPVYPVILGPRCTASVPRLGEPSPNPCFERTSSGYTGFEDKSASLAVSIAPVLGPSTVVRYSNPDVWFSLGVSHLARSSSATTATAMPERGLTIQLALGSGFSRMTVPIANLVSMPAWLVDGPDGYVYLVDQGDIAGSTGSRGQVRRFDRSSTVVDNFIVR